MAFGVALLAISPVSAMAAQSSQTTSKPAVHVTHRETVHREITHSANIVKVSSHTEISRKATVREASVSHAVLLKGSKARYAMHASGRSYGGISCVPFARIASGIELKGNAANWWDAAAGVYARGQQPEGGSVLNFRATGGMRLGHVAVVTRVVNSREIEIDHANWWGPGASKGGVSRGVSVVDVSENNDWSAVRVGLGHTGGYGSVYPTYGFIYDRPDTGYAAKSVGATYDEVAEAPVRSLR
jgi:surface antigen